MADDKKITVKPISFGISGFKVEDLLLKDFMGELKRELPTSLIGHFLIGFSDSKDLVAISHDRVEGKFKLDRVDVEGTNAEFVSRVVEVLKKVLT